MNIAIVEDNPISASLLKEYIENGDTTVEATYISAEEAIQNISEQNMPDVMLIDIGLPGISGIELTRILKNKFPGLEIIIQTIFEESDTIIEAIKAGASGYILKASMKEEIKNAIFEVTKGGSFLTGKVAKKILQEFKTEETRKSGTTGNQEYRLTQREEEILNELIRGASYKEIAWSLCISTFTVNNHLRKIYEKMQVHSRGEAVAKALNQKSPSPSTS